MECSAVLVCGSSFQKGPLLADYDLVIIGGGPAGLTAGLYAARANMSAVLLEGKDVGGEILNTDLIEDYPGFASVTGAELAQKMAEHALKFGLKIETYAPVKQIRVEGDRKVIELEDGTTHRAYAVIITVGGEPTKLGVPGEAEYHGRGVSYCAVCDGAFFKGSDLAVIGGGDSAFQEGLFLTRFAKKLHVVHRRGDFRAQAILRDRLLAKDLVHTVTPATVKEIGGDGTAVKWIDVERDGKVERIPVEGVFVFVGLLCLAYLSIKLGKLEMIGGDVYEVEAQFNSASGLKPGSTIEIAGVEVGRVRGITLIEDRAKVKLAVNNTVKLYTDTFASIKTRGIIGEKFLALSPGGGGALLKPGDTIRDTESGLDLEELVSQYVHGNVK